MRSSTLSCAMAGKRISYNFAKSIADILKVDIEEIFYVTKKEQLYSANSISKVKRAVRCIFAMAKRQRIIENNYASADYISYGRKQRSKVRYLDDANAKQLFKAVMDYSDIRAKTAILILLLTGIRKGGLQVLNAKILITKTEDCMFVGQVDIVVQLEYLLSYRKQKALYGK